MYLGGGKFQSELPFRSIAPRLQSWGRTMAPLLSGTGVGLYWTKVKGTFHNSRPSALSSAAKLAPHVVNTVSRVSAASWTIRAFCGAHSVSQRFCPDFVNESAFFVVEKYRFPSASRINALGMSFRSTWYVHLTVPERSRA